MLLQAARSAVGQRELAEKFQRIGEQPAPRVVSCSALLGRGGSN